MTVAFVISMDLMSLMNLLDLMNILNFMNIPNLVNVMDIILLVIMGFHYFFFGALLFREAILLWKIRRAVDILAVFGCVLDISDDTLVRLGYRRVNIFFVFLFHHFCLVCLFGLIVDMIILFMCLLMTVIRIDHGALSNLIYHIGIIRRVWNESLFMIGFGRRVRHVKVMICI